MSLATPTMTVTSRSKAVMLGEALVKGTSSRSNLCPKCNGGMSEESSFIISKDNSGRIRWRCFRGSCGFKGASGGVVGAVGGTKPEEAETRPLKVSYTNLPASQEAEFEEEFGFTPPPHLVKWIPEGQYYAHNVLGLGGGHRGWHLRRYSWQEVPEDGRPRADNYRASTHPFICHYTKHGTGMFRNNPGPVVVVEDCVSALWLSLLGINSVALLGTVLNLDRVYDILAAPYGGKIILALDKGTRDLQLRYRDQYSFLFESWTQWVLDKDLKYVDRLRIGQAYVHGKTDFISS